VRTTLLLIALLAGCEKKDKAAPPISLAANESPTVPAVVPPAPKPSAPLPSETSCISAECHSTYARAKYIHGPVSAKACDACHEADVGGHKYPLKRDATATCTYCHVVSGSMTHQHRALEQGCTSCHRPHESQTKYLLKTDTVERLCATCHEVPLKKFAHGPFARGECTLCHLPHQADNPKLLRGGDGPNHCLACHKEMGQKLASASHVHKPAGQSCTTCHSPHAADFDHQLKLSVQQTCLGCHEKVKKQVAQASVAHGAMLSEKQCGNCHDAHASNEPQLLKQRMDQVCMGCHNKPLAATDGHTIPSMKPSVTDAKFKHGPVQSGDCSGCHQAHGGQRADLLVRTFPPTFYTNFAIEKYDLCFGCHQRDLVMMQKTGNLTNFRNGNMNLHYVHVHRDEKGRTCKTCHAVHGSDLPKHMAGEVPFEGSNWPMPIQYEQTSEGGRCSPGCHKPREYNRSAATTQPAVIRGEP
jgi:predicted CXXCH cytochrome family protein